MIKLTTAMWILLICIAIFVYTIVTSVKNIDSQYKSKIDSLNNHIELNERKIDTLNSILPHLNDSIVYLNLKIEDNNKKIVIIKQKYNEKIALISKFDTNDIQRYFAKRYGSISRDTTKSTNSRD